jgi:hypothetical protein
MNFPVTRKGNHPRKKKKKKPNQVQAIFERTYSFHGRTDKELVVL